MANSGFVINTAILSLVPV